MASSGKKARRDHALIPVKARIACGPRSIGGQQGVVAPAKLQANSASAPVYVAQALGGGFWAKMMALARTLSVIAATGRAARAARLSPRIAISPVWTAR